MTSVTPCAREREIIAVPILDRPTTKMMKLIAIAAALALIASANALEWTGSEECEAEAFDWYGTSGIPIAAFPSPPRPGRR